MTTLWIILGVVAVVILWLILAYNRLITLKNRAKEAWSDIEVQLKRRYDLIPNLVQTVKGYAKHEQSAFENVTKARAEALKGGGTAHEQAVKENMLTGALKSIFAIAEAYPELKANTNFLELQRELSDTENKIQASRRFYNTTVMDLNTAIQTFPTNLMAKPFSFKEEAFFDAPEAEEQPVKVQF